MLRQTLGDAHRVTSAWGRAGPSPGPAGRRRWDSAGRGPGRRGRAVRDWAPRPALSRSGLRPLTPQGGRAEGRGGGQHSGGTHRVLEGPQDGGGDHPQQQPQDVEHGRGPEQPVELERVAAGTDAHELVVGWGAPGAARRGACVTPSRGGAAWASGAQQGPGASAGRCSRQRTPRPFSPRSAPGL